MTFHSYTERHLCADNEMVRGILLAVLAPKQEAKRGGTVINKMAATVGVGTVTVQRVRAEKNPFESGAAA